MSTQYNIPLVVLQLIIVNEFTSDPVVEVAAITTKYDVHRRQEEGAREGRSPSHVRV